MPAIAAAYGYLGEGPDVRHWPHDAVIDSPAALLPLLGSA
jgi:phosphoglycolate phosphatase-like HAD superfamily hydrolase